MLGLQFILHYMDCPVKAEVPETSDFLGQGVIDIVRQ